MQSRDWWTDVGLLNAAEIFAGLAEPAQRGFISEASASGRCRTPLAQIAERATIRVLCQGMRAPDSASAEASPMKPRSAGYSGAGDADCKILAAPCASGARAVVAYNPDLAALTVTFKDAATGATVKTLEVSGRSIAFQTDDDIL